MLTPILRPRHEGAAVNHRVLRMKESVPSDDALIVVVHDEPDGPARSDDPRCDIPFPLVDSPDGSSFQEDFHFDAP